MKTSRIGVSLLAMAALAMVGIVSADDVTKEGYVIDSSGEVVKSDFGLCWHTGFWTSAMAIAECDPDFVKVAAVEPEPEKAPEPPEHVVITLQSDTLFEFNKSTIRAEGRKDLDDEVVGKMKDNPQIERVLVTGHTDRIGSEAYNQKLSQRRADAVKDYLVAQGIDAARIETAAKGESMPVASCDEVKGKVSGLNKDLVECLKPNRRVEVEIKLQKPVQR
jgi:OOP family OmpA-OmpF porin